MLFSQNLRSARKAKNLTLRELGNRVKLSIGYLSDMEHDRKPPPKNIDMITKLETALNMTRGSLLLSAQKSRIRIKKEKYSELLKELTTE